MTAMDKCSVRLVQAAIDRIKDAINEWRKVEADPAATHAQRETVRERMAQAEHEFGWQWRNIEAILQSLQKEEL